LNTPGPTICIIYVQVKARYFRSDRIVVACTPKIEPSRTAFGAETPIRTHTNAFTNNIVWRLKVLTAAGLREMAISAAAEHWLLLGRPRRAAAGAEALI
jgi:hypothetical protein